VHFDLINQCLTEYCELVPFFNSLFPCNEPVSFFLPQESKRRIFGCEGLLTDKSYEKSRHVFMIPWTRSFQNNASNEMTIT